MVVSTFRRLALVASAPALVAVAFAGSPPAAAHGPTLATEDTMHTQVSQVLVSAPRVTLDEILDRVARGEARRESLMQDQSFLATMRVVRNTAGHGQPQLFAEEVQRVYKKRPGKVRTVELRHYEEKPDRKGGGDSGGDGGDDLTFSSGFGEDLVTFAFQPDARRHYRYQIEDRTLLGDHLIYRIGFAPRSALDFDDPSGTVWVDTKDFVIVRQEIGFARSPVPLLLKGIPRMVIEREKIGDAWVLSRVLARIELTFAIPKFGSSLDFALALSDYTINSGLPDSLFAGTPPGPPPGVRITKGEGRKGGTR